MLLCSEYASRLCRHSGGWEIANTAGVYITTSTLLEWRNCEVVNFTSDAAVSALIPIAAQHFCCYITLS